MSPKPSKTHLVLIPSYNPGAKVFETVRAARAAWAPVWIVVDGSDDGTPEKLHEMAATDGDLRVFVLARNRGKGSAVLHGIGLAQAQGFTHVLTLDSDGQHPAALIPEFMALSQSHPGAMVLGVPVFDESAPRIRVYGRRLSNWWASVETLGGGIRDTLYGFRVYPIAELVDIMGSQPWRMRRFDFDPEVAVRLAWRGVPALNVPAPVKYFRPDEGGVSHFNYLRDNVLLTSMHARLVLEFLVRLPFLVWRRARAAIVSL
jgi:glycosyltransferase involved in cell wall biosynthesis